jgi:acyl carrier protein
MFAAIWAGILGRTQVGIHDNFFELGGHSLIATRIISRVREAFQIELPLRTLFESPTIARLAEKVDAVRHAASGLPMLPLQKVSRDGSLPLSFSQQRLWFLDQLEPNNPFYNMPQAIRLTGVLDTGALEQTIAEIIKRHESLRTVFKFIDGMPTQVIKEAVPLTISLTNLGSLPESEREAEARRLARP